MAFSGSVFAIEASFFVYSLYWNSTWGWNELRASISLLLFFLASYQLSEVLICSFDKKRFGKIYGHFSITLLPPLGLWLIRSSQTPTYGLEYVATFFAIMFLVVFFQDADAVQIIACEKCFVRYRYKRRAVHYGKYYFGAIVAALLLLVSEILRNMAEKVAIQVADLPVLILAGYLVFLIPTSISVYVFKMDGSLVSSTMCKWASLFAITLVIILLRST